MTDGRCVGCGLQTLNLVECLCTREFLACEALLRIGRSLALRYLPRLGAPGGSRGFLPLPGCYGDRPGAVLDLE